MELLTLYKFETPTKKTRFLFSVSDGTRIIAQRRTNRNYVACYASKMQDKDGNDFYKITHCFSRVDLIGAGDSKHAAPDYVACLPEVHLQVETFLKTHQPLAYVGKH